MKIYSNQADNYIDNLKANNGLAILIYGPDLGAVRNYRNRLISKLSPDIDQLGIIELTAEQIKSDPSILLGEIDSPNFFSTKKIITIDGINAAVSEAVNNAATNISSDLSIILTAEELGKESKLRSFFENHQNFPAIICYKEDARSIRNLVSDKFRQQNVKLDNATLNFLCNNLGEDKQITLNEIEKIFIYLDDQKSLSFEEVTELLADSSELTLNDIAYAISLKNPVNVEKSLAKAFAEHVSMIAVIRSLLFAFSENHDRT